MSKPSRQPSDFDNPWKETLERFFPEFLAFFFPHAHADVDWAKGYEFLDKDLKRVTREAAVGERRVDALVKIWHKNGVATWVLVHIEVQSQDEAAFAERMYVYNYRLFDRFHRRVASLAILGDERASWRPDRFEYTLWGCRVSLEFPIVKLVDYRERWAELEESRNPFALVVMTHLKALETRERPLDRQAWKLALVRRLYQRGHRREDIVGLLRFIDGILALPKELEIEFWEEVNQLEEGKRMPYILSLERIGMEKGAIRQLMRVLKFRFGAVPDTVERMLQQLDLVRLEDAIDFALSSDSLETFCEATGLQPA